MKHHRRALNALAISAVCFVSTVSEGFSLTPVTESSYDSSATGSFVSSAMSIVLPLPAPPAAPLLLATHQPNGQPAKPAPAQGSAERVSGLPWNSGMACYTPAFETFRGRKADVYVAFVGRERRADVIANMRGNAIGRFASMPGQLALSWPMLPGDIAFQFAECAQGRHDQFVRDGANALKAHGFVDPIVRLGWEVNGKYPWSLGPYPNRVDDYKACFQRQVDLFRSILPGVVIEWSNRRAGQIPYSIERAYPGDAYVDIISMMLYDRWPPHPNQQSWDAAYNKRDQFGGPFGFGSYLDFAKSRNKKLAVSEWAISNNDNDPRSADNPFYISKMYETFQANAEHLAYEAYFNCGSEGGYQLVPQGVNPRGGARYQELWRQP